MGGTTIGLAEILKREYVGLSNFAGTVVRIPIRKADPTEVAWRDAVRWLEERRAADQEWPWPRWRDAEA